MKVQWQVIDHKYVPIPWADFAITPDGTFLVLDATKDMMKAAPQVDHNQVMAPGQFATVSKTVDAYWAKTLSTIRFPLSLRNVEDLLHERGIDIGHGQRFCVRSWLCDQPRQSGSQPILTHRFQGNRRRNSHQVARSLRGIGASPLPHQRLVRVHPTAHSRQFVSNDIRNRGRLAECSGLSSPGPPYDSQRLCAGPGLPR